uniref:Transmembrane protein n=1 Tax=Neospora caninum (strain Liverpool) TaxID=572307 RepID=A0A0F7UIS8_NEOCL|nr:TPA: hypothetical protein BN1204_046615 [Neospora caninum Liverpool]
MHRRRRRHRAGEEDDPKEGLRGREEKVGGEAETIRDKTYYSQSLGEWGKKPLFLLAVGGLHHCLKCLFFFFCSRQTSKRLRRLPLASVAPRTPCAASPVLSFLSVHLLRSSPGCKSPCRRLLSLSVLAVSALLLFSSGSLSASFPLCSSPPRCLSFLPPRAAPLHTSAFADSSPFSLPVRASPSPSSSGPSFDASACSASSTRAASVKQNCAQSRLAAFANRHFPQADWTASSLVGSRVTFVAWRSLKREASIDASAPSSRVPSSHFDARLSSLSQYPSSTLPNSGASHRAAFACASCGCVTSRCHSLPFPCRSLLLSSLPSLSCAFSSLSGAPGEAVSALQTEEPSPLLSSLSRALKFFNARTLTSSPSPSSSPSSPPSSSLPRVGFPSASSPFVSSSDPAFAEVAREPYSEERQPCSEEIAAAYFSPPSSHSSAGLPSRLSTFYSSLPSWRSAPSRAAAKHSSSAKKDPVCVPYRAVDLIALFGRLLFLALLPLYAQLYVQCNEGQQNPKPPDFPPAIVPLEPRATCETSPKPSSPSFLSPYFSSFSLSASASGPRSWLFPWFWKSRGQVFRCLAAIFSSLSAVFTATVSSTPSSASRAAADRRSEAGSQFRFAGSTASHFRFPPATLLSSSRFPSPLSAVSLSELAETRTHAWSTFSRSLFSRPDVQRLDFRTFARRLLRLPFQWPPFAFFLPCANVYCYQRGVYRHLDAIPSVLDSLSAEVEAEQPHPAALFSLFHVLGPRDIPPPPFVLPHRNAKEADPRTPALDAEAVRRSLLRLCREAVSHDRKEEEMRFRRPQESGVEQAALTLWRMFERKVDAVTLRLAEGDWDVPAT